ncbi:MAG: sigma-54-dependent Fis family transcriptional regulator, partial [Bacteroidetes bacterium]
GATDYFAKPFRLLDIQNAITRTQRFIDLNRKLKVMETGLDKLSKQLLENIGTQLLGKSKAMKQLTTMMAKVAHTDDTSVLILGESGTGKELVAHGIHYMSNRNKNTFYSVNCSAIPESLFESEFFGHKKGSFTGANEDKKGWFEIADGGTLFLDEISDMPLGQQAKLLRVLEERKVSKVGSRESVTVDVRVIAASNKNLEELTMQNKFRLDLFHRLSIFVIDVPSLRERMEDVPILTDYFLKMYATKHNEKVNHISDEAMKLLTNHDFPGNVRELRNQIQRAIIMCEGNELLPEHFKISQKNGNGNNQETIDPASQTITIVENKDETEDFDLESNEKKLILKALEKAEGNKAKAAALLRITWQALDRRMKKYGLE